MDILARQLSQMIRLSYLNLLRVSPDLLLARALIILFRIANSPPHLLSSFLIPHSSFLHHHPRLLCNILSFSPDCSFSTVWLPDTVSSPRRYFPFPPFNFNSTPSLYVFPLAIPIRYNNFSRRLETIVELFASCMVDISV